MPRLHGDGISRSMRERFSRAVRNHDRAPEQGALLVEILVGMFILIVVFTATTVALSNMSDIRVNIEHRDRALAILSSYEEQSRVFKCGLIVDRIDDALATDPLGGTAQFTQSVENCDFAAKATLDGVAQNPADQDFVLQEPVNENDTVQNFTIKIRYWWESPGSYVQFSTCQRMVTDYGPSGALPLILARAFYVGWKEKGVDRSETLVTRDAIPSDNVVFASGNRSSALVNRPSSVSDGSEWNAIMFPILASGDTAVDPDFFIRRHIDGLLGQPTRCVWFPYITPDDKLRSITNEVTPSEGVLPRELPPQSLVVVG